MFRMSVRTRRVMKPSKLHSHVILHVLSLHPIKLQNPTLPQAVPVGLILNVLALIQSEFRIPHSHKHCLWMWSYTSSNQISESYTPKRSFCRSDRTHPPSLGTVASTMQFQVFCTQQLKCQLIQLLWGCCFLFLTLMVGVGGGCNSHYPSRLCLC